MCSLAMWLLCPGDTGMRPLLIPFLLFLPSATLVKGRKLVFVHISKMAAESPLVLFL